ncbi:helix-turn-helix transcriptional regulator [Nocardioides sp.]|uniref:helix-turn-helix domain-containing protein n=1 Tax=Nocardioides sp. TaxID=35761 RepID=UPI002B8A5ED9|nr:helix-turn-helix transcriptional regulator [Nocardioides sp.]HXH79563.1 helix-turn-helix transcriptional regulator [Nocardioides sp.]
MGSLLGAYVRTYREGKGLTLKAFGDRIGKSKEYVSQLELRTKLPDADIRRRIAEAMGVSHLDLLIAAGELLPEEVTAAGKVGVVEEDADSPATVLVERLRSARLDAAQVEAIEIMLKTWGR